MLYVQTNTANVHAIDAETGKTLWSKQIGSPDHPSMPLDARGDMLAVVNGSRLYVVNRFNGDLLYEKTCKYAAARSGLEFQAGLRAESRGVARRLSRGTGGCRAKLGKAESELATPAKPQTEAERRANVRVKQKATAPVFCQSFGGSPVQPLVTRNDLTSEYVVWPTDRGYLNLGRINRDADSSLVVKYRLTTGATIVARPAYLPPDPQDARRCRRGLCRLVRRVRVRRAGRDRRDAVAIFHG